MKRHNHYCTFEGVESDAEPRVEGDGEWVRYEDAMAALAAERERCAQYLRDAAKRLAPEGKRTSHMDRHTADVLATKGDELAGGCHLRA